MTFELCLHLGQELELRVELGDCHLKRDASVCASTGSGKERLGRADFLALHRATTHRDWRRHGKPGHENLLLVVSVHVDGAATINDRVEDVLRLGGREKQVVLGFELNDLRAEQLRDVQAVCRERPQSWHDC